MWLSKQQLETIISAWEPMYHQLLDTSIVFASDEWAHHISKAANQTKKGERQERTCSIVNTDDSRSKGKHWVVVMIEWEVQEDMAATTIRRETDKARRQRLRRDAYEANMRIIRDTGFDFPVLSLAESLPTTEGIARIFDVVNFEETDSMVKMLKSFGMHVLQVRTGTATNNANYAGYTSARIAAVVDENFATADYLKAWHEDEVVQMWEGRRAERERTMPATLGNEEVEQIWRRYNQRSIRRVGTSDEFAKWLAQELVKETRSNLVNVGGRLIRFP